MSPAVIVCAGGGGVGKTTSSAALGLAAARAGQRVLIVTIDPARRLADALGVSLSHRPQIVEMVPDGRLQALMPDPRVAMRRFVDLLFVGDPAAHQRVLENRLYQVMEDAVPGIHELVTMSLVGEIIAQGSLDLVVIDTAPSRNALDFVAYPQRLAKLLGGKAMVWLGGLTAQKKGVRPSQSKRPSGMQRLLERGLGPVIYDVGGLSSELASVLDRFKSLNQSTADLLMSKKTRYVLVAAPSGAAEDDAQFLYERLRALKLRPAAILLNATVVDDKTEFAELDEVAGPNLSVALAMLRQEREQRRQATDHLRAALARLNRTLVPICLPFLGPLPPAQIVARLADAMVVSLPALLGHD